MAEAIGTVDPSVVERRARFLALIPQIGDIERKLDDPVWVRGQIASLEERQPTWALDEPDLEFVEQQVAKLQHHMEDVAWLRGRLAYLEAKA